MRRLGISVYPSQSKLADILDYIDLAAKYGYSRIFTCLISEQGESIDDTIADFKKITAKANSNGMEVIGDVEPSVFEKFSVSYQNLQFFHDIGMKGLRLDLGFSGQEEAIMSFNKFGLKIELNASQGTKHIDTILSYSANKDKIVGCHNFYPHRYTGLGYDHFLQCTKHFKDLGIRTAAFVNAPSAKIGPWPVAEGICTLEEHRDLPITIQAKHLLASNVIDDVIIANAFASEQELKALSEIDRNMLELSVNFMPDISVLEKKIILEELHLNRGDRSEYMIRSSQTREKYAAWQFPPHNNQTDIQPGDIIIESSLYQRYAGELQIALKPMQNSGKSNIVAKLLPEEFFLLKYLEPWMKFKFTEAK